MDAIHVREGAEERKVIALADYRRRVSSADEHPPPPPRPCAARRPAALTSTDVFGSIQRHRKRATRTH